MADPHLQSPDDWTSLSEAIEHHSASSASPAQQHRGVYVNLLNNPEGFTGYGGPSARRVWRSITEENCFGELDDVCLEKRVFYRSVPVAMVLRPGLLCVWVVVNGCKSC